MDRNLQKAVGDGAMQKLNLRFRGWSYSEAEVGVRRHSLGMAAAASYIIRIGIPRLYETVIHTQTQLI